MEKIIKLVQSLEISPNLFKLCRCQLFHHSNIQEIKLGKENNKCIIKINMEYEFIYDKLYIGQWNQVPEYYRSMFLNLSFLKAYLLIKNNSNNEENLLESLRILDLGIIIGAGLKEIHCLTEFAELLHSHIDILYPSFKLLDTSSRDNFQSHFCCDIDILDNPSVEKFWTSYLYLNKPALLHNSVNHWPAFKRWIDLNYFMKIARNRTVPIELGKKYDNDDWSQGLFKFGDFLMEYMREDSKPNKQGYLAQHELQNQIPQLNKDIIVPDYCAISSEKPVIKYWIGPKGTISTTHTDPNQNLLCQLLGEKLVILAAPDQAPFLYLYEGILNNTSQVDPENADYTQFPLSKNIKFLKIILKAGDMLFIPKLWFHYVRSLTPSISVSFWFNSDDE